MSKIKEIVGTWAPLLEEEFKKPYMKKLYEKIQFRKKNVLDQFQPKEGDLFEVFKQTPLDKLKVIVISEDPQFDRNIPKEIEESMRDGLDIEVAICGNFNWLCNQGVMFLPRRLSWGTQQHDEWLEFTDEVILKATSMERPVLVVTNSSTVIGMLDVLRRDVEFIGKINPWPDIDAWVKKHYKEDIVWTPCEEHKSF